MLFRKKVFRACQNCQHGTKIDEDKILCTRKGVVSCDGKCWKFKYDPCKRIPMKQKAMDFSKYEKEDYSL